MNRIATMIGAAARETIMAGIALGIVLTVFGAYEYFQRVGYAVDTAERAGPDYLTVHELRIEDVTIPNDTLVTWERTVRLPLQSHWSLEIWEVDETANPFLQLCATNGEADMAPAEDQVLHFPRSSRFGVAPQFLHMRCHFLAGRYYRAFLTVTATDVGTRIAKTYDAFQSNIFSARG